MATHSSVLAWRIPGTGEPGGLPSMGSHRVGHDWSDLRAAAALPIRRKTNKQTNKQKLRTNLTLYEAYTNHWTNLMRAETKKKKEFNLEVWEKETSNRISLKKTKRQRDTTQMKEQARNTEVQINEEEGGKLPEREFRIMIVKMTKKPWKQNGENPRIH